MGKRKFGDAGKKIIVEEFIEGFEISFFAFFDKKSFLPLGYALDHKKAYENDAGPNTGGMGCFYSIKFCRQRTRKKYSQKYSKKKHIMDLKKIKLIIKV